MRRLWHAAGRKPPKWMPPRPRGKLAQPASGGREESMSVHKVPDSKGGGWEVRWRQAGRQRSKTIHDEDQAHIFDAGRPPPPPARHARRSRRRHRAAARLGGRVALQVGREPARPLDARPLRPSLGRARAAQIGRLSAAPAHHRADRGRPSRRHGRGPRRPRHPAQGPLPAPRPSSATRSAASESRTTRPRTSNGRGSGSGRCGRSRWRRWSGCWPDSNLATACSSSCSATKASAQAKPWH